MHAAEGISLLKNELKRERQIKTELLAACKEALECLSGKSARESTESWIEDRQRTRATLRSAIARASGPAATTEND